MKIEDRLTAFVDLKEFCKSVPEAYGAVIRGNSRACDEAFQRYPFLPVAIDRLRRYEDTGLSPEEIEELKHRLKQTKFYMSIENENPRKQLDDVIKQLQNALATNGDGTSFDVRITFTVKLANDCDNGAALQKDEACGKQRIPWEAD